MGFSRQYWNVLPFTSPGIFSTQGSHWHLLCFPHWQVDSFTTESPGKPSKEQWPYPNLYSWRGDSTGPSLCLCDQQQRCRSSLLGQGQEWLSGHTRLLCPQLSLSLLIESLMLSNQLILCSSLLFFFFFWPSIFPQDQCLFR